jgi:hypothetical protein
MRRLLDLGADANLRLERRPANLYEMIAAEANHICIVVVGMTVLHIAAQRGYLAVVKLLLERGANPEALSKHSRTPLHVALSTGREKTARIISRSMTLSELPSRPTAEAHSVAYR